MKRLFITILSVFLLLGIANWGNKAQASEKYPVKPITYIMPIEAGSDADLMTRPFVQKASAILGHPIMVVNKPGGGGNIGWLQIHDAKPDGYTVGTVYTSLLISNLKGLIPYDHNDFTIFGSYYRWNPIIVASTKTKRPFKTIEEVISFAKLHPGEISIATTSVGGGWWTATMVFVDSTGLKFNVIPQEGAGAYSIAQAAGGHTDLAILGIAAAQPQIEAGNVKLLALLGPERLPGQYSNIPTLKEVGYDAIYHTFSVVVGPPKMPKDIVDKLIKTFEAAANDPEYHKYLAGIGAFPTIWPTEKCIKEYNEQKKQFRVILEKAGLLKK